MRFEFRVSGFGKAAAKKGVSSFRFRVSAQPIAHNIVPIDPNAKTPKPNRGYSHQECCGLAVPKLETPFSLSNESPRHSSLRTRLQLPCDCSQHRRSEGSQCGNLRSYLEQT